MCRSRNIADSRLSRLALWLFLAGVLLRGLIPVGYMIDYRAIENGSSPVVLCPTGLEGTLIFDLLTMGQNQHGGGHHHGPDAGDDQARAEYEAPCIFAAVASLAVALISLAFLLSLWPSIRNRLAPENDRRPDYGTPLPIGARAPPLPA